MVKDEAAGRELTTSMCMQSGSSVYKEWLGGGGGRGQLPLWLQKTVQEYITLHELGLTCVHIIHSCPDYLQVCHLPTRLPKSYTSYYIHVERIDTPDVER